MSQLFAVLAGKAEDTFAIGGVVFMAAPLTIAEYAEFKITGTEGDVQAEFWAGKLRARVHEPTKTDPATITAEWYMENVPVSLVPTLIHLLIEGEMPRTGAGGTPKA